MNTKFYFEREVKAEYSDSYTCYIEVDAKLLNLFLIEHGKERDTIMIGYEDIDEQDRGDIEIYVPQKIEELVTEKPTDIMRELSNKYKDFLKSWVSTGQNPEQWGISIGGGRIVTEDKLEEVSKEYPKEQYVDKRLEKEMQDRRRHNEKVNKTKNLYKDLGLDEYV